MSINQKKSYCSCIQHVHECQVQGSLSIYYILIIIINNCIETFWTPCTSVLSFTYIYFKIKRWQIYILFCILNTYTLTEYFFQVSTMSSKKMAYFFFLFSVHRNMQSVVITYTLHTGCTDTFSLVVDNEVMVYLNIDIYSVFRCIILIAIQKNRIQTER